MNKLLIPAFVSGGVVSYLALETQFDRLDRVVLFTILLAAYLVVFGGIAAALTISLRLSAARVPLTPESRRTLESFLFLGPLLINVLLGVFGHKNIVFAARPVLAGRITLQIAASCMGLAVLLFVLRFIYRLPDSARRWGSVAIPVLISLAILLPHRAPTIEPIEVSPLTELAHTADPISESPVILIGLDGIDAKLLKAAIATGQLPRFRAFIDGGFVSRLDFGEMALSPIIWTSLSTGKTRFQHGIHDFVTIKSPLFRRELGTWWSYIPPGLGVKSVFVHLRQLGLVTERVANGLDRRGPSIWQLLSAHDLSSVVVNYMVSWPAEEVSGVFISQYLYHRDVDLSEIQPTAISPVLQLPSFGFEYPQGVVDRLGLTPSQKAPSVPTKLGEAEFEYVAEIALLLAREEAFDLMSFYTHWPDSFNHAMTPRDYESALSGSFSTKVSRELLACLARIDRFLGELHQRVEEVNFIVVSDHGVQLGHNGKREIVQHAYAPPGIFLAMGPDISPRKQAAAVSVLDVVPTLLSYFGLPVGADMQGEVVKELFGAEGAPSFVASYDELIENRRVQADQTPDMKEVEERLRSLGYLQ